MYEEMALIPSIFLFLMNAKRHFSCRWKYLYACLEERSNSRGLLRRARIEWERERKREVCIYICVQLIFCVVEQLSHTVASFCRHYYYHHHRRHHFLPSSSVVYEYRSERLKEKMKVNHQRGRERSLIDIGRCVRFASIYRQVLLMRNEHIIRHSTVTNFELLKIVFFSFFFLILCKLFRSFTCSSIIRHEKMSSLSLQEEEEMFSPPTTPSTGTPISSSSSILSTTTTTTTTTTPVPAPVTTAEKTHGIAIDEPSASFFFSSIALCLFLFFFFLS